MVKLLDASIAEGAVEGSTRFDDSAVEAKVLEVDTLLIRVSKEVLFLFRCFALQ